MRSTPRHPNRLQRRPQLEVREDRTAPAVLTVNLLTDSVANDNLLSLREAINAVNAQSAAGLDAGAAGQITGTFGSGDTIQFDPSLFTGGAQTLSLGLGEFPIHKSLTLNGPGASLLTLDAQQNSRIFNISPTSGLFVSATVALDGLTLTNGQTTATFIAGYGGAIRSFVTATGGLTVSNCTITNCSTLGPAAAGGGIAAFNALTIDNSIISNNSAASDGGGIFSSAGTRTITNCTIANNQAAGVGGGIKAKNNGTLTVTNCQVSGNSALAGGGMDVESLDLLVMSSQVIGNSATGTNVSGGGIFTSHRNVTVENSTISGNSVAGANAPGGGLALLAADRVTVANCTISGNSTTGANASGGGLYTDMFNSLTVQDCTISGNSALGTGASGGGLVALADEFQGERNPVQVPIALTNDTISGNSTAGAIGGADLIGDAVTLSSTIVAANSDNGTDPDLSVTPEGAFPPSGTVDHNLIGNNTGTTLTATGATPDANGNFVGSAASPINPLLAPVGNYGGPTPTQALLPGSLAFDHGTANGLTSDQRGDPRVLGSAADIGAFESHGFTLSFVSGSQQSAAINTAFGSGLVVQVTSNDPLEPVAGGVVTYTGPGSGASIAPNPSTATIAANGLASLLATANGVVGYYSVTAAALGATGTAAFSLGNGKATELADSLIAYIKSLIATNVIGNGTGTSLINAYLKHITDTSGISDIDSFIAMVQKDVQQGKVPPDIGAILIDRALVIRSGLTS
jgi:hypothetical protein